MIIYSWNINGYQTCDKYGGLSKIIEEQPEFICLQEVKIGDSSCLNNLFTYSYEHYYNFASDKGCNGVYVYAKYKAINCYYNIGYSRFDKEGRFICLEFDKYFLINVYMPHGGRDKRNLDYKLESYYYLMEYLNSIKYKEIVIVGDFNIACSELDVERYRNNVDNIMFTKQEREIFAKILNMGYIDAYRQKNPLARQYTWWPYAFNARERDIGWRIDYCLVTPNFMKYISNIQLLKEVLGSDHCPVRVLVQKYIS